MQEPDAGRDALMKIRQVEFLIGCMYAIVRQAECNQGRGQSELVVKGCDRGIGATRPHEDRCCSKAFVARSRGSSDQRMTAIDNDRFGSELQLCGRAQSEWREARNMIATE